MSIIRKLLGLKAQKPDAHLEKRAEETERLIKEERQEFRQTLQRADSGVRLMQTWDGAMRMMREKK